MQPWFQQHKTFNKGAIDPIKYPLRKLPEKSDGLELLALGRNDYNLPETTKPGDDGFDAELAEVLRVRHDVANGIWPSWFLKCHNIDSIPAAPFRSDIRGVNIDGTDPSAAANIVEMDEPDDLGRLLRTYLRERGYRVKSDDTGHGGFYETIPQFNHALAKAMRDALWEASQAKYFFGRPRPEEVVGFNCTHYSNGAPKHPSDPAGHGAAAGATLAVIEDQFGLAQHDEAWMTVFTTCAQWAMFRTFAGVHYANDNARGFLLGYAKIAGLDNAQDAAQALEWGYAYV